MQFEFQLSEKLRRFYGTSAWVKSSYYSKSVIGGGLLGFLVLFPIVLTVQRIWHLHENSGHVGLHYHGVTGGLTWAGNFMFSFKSLPWAVMFIFLGAFLGFQYKMITRRFETEILNQTLKLDKAGIELTSLKTDFVGLELIKDINLALNQHKGLPEILRILSVGLTSSFGYDASAVYLIDEDRKHASLISYSTKSDIVKKIEKLIGLKFLGYKAPIIEGDLLSEIIQKNHPIVSEDLAKIVEVQAHAKKLTRFSKQIIRISGMKYGVGAPLTTANNVIGVIGLASKKPIDKMDIERLSIFANWAAMAIERSKMDIEIINTNKKLLTSNQTKDFFIDILRHDLLNPVCVVRNLSEIALNEENMTPRNEMLGEVLKSSENIIEMVESASMFAKIESGDKLNFDIENVGHQAQNAIDEVRDLADSKNISLKTDVNKKMVATVNPMIKNVFTNLLTNAIKYSPTGSTVWVSLINKGDMFLFTVEDEGPGIPDEYKENIFDRFTRIKKGAVKGTGLGLAIVKKIVELHNGRTIVEDRPDGGSIFKVEIPITSVTEEKKQWRSLQ